MLKAVLLDVDGTLIDSNDAHAAAFVSAAALHGREIPFREVRALIGTSGENLLSEVLKVDPEAEIIERISETKKQLFKKDHLPQLKPFPKVRELLIKMKERGLKLIVASSASEEELKGLLDRVGISDLVDGRPHEDNVDSPKPAPDIVFEALKTENLDTDEAVFIGDTPYDVTAAQTAGVKSIALLTGGWPVEALGNATAIYKDPAELLKDFDQSILNSAQPADLHS